MNAVSHRPSESDALERQADALLRQLPAEQRADIALGGQARAGQTGGRQDRFREVALSDMAAALDAGPEQQTTALLQVEQVLSAAELLREERAMFLLKHRYQLTDREIAELFGCSRDTVIERRRVVRRKLDRVVHRLERSPSAPRES